MFEGVLTGVAARSPSDAWAIGHAGRGPLVEHWNGERWKVVHLPPGVEAVADVAAPRHGEAWLLGRTKGGPVVLRSDGRSWTPAGALNLPQAASLAVVSDEDAWVVGGSQFAHWNGTTWSVGTAPPGVGLMAVGASARNVWAVGQAHGGDAVVLRWDRTRWDRSYTLNPGVSDGQSDDEWFNSVVVRSGNDVWAAGGYTVNAFMPPETQSLIAHFDGKRWRTVDDGGADVLGLAVPAAHDVWAAESDEPDWAGATGNGSSGGSVSHGTGPGAGWHATDVGPGRRLLALAPVPAAARAHAVWAVGEIGAGTTVDGGDFPLYSVPLIRRFDCWETDGGHVTDAARVVAQPTAVFSPDGARVASAGGIWSVLDGSRSARLPGPGVVAFDHTGRHVVVAAADGTATLADAGTGRRLHVFASNIFSCSEGRCPLGLDAAAFSPNGKLLATGGDDTRARIWDARSHRLLHTLSGHASAVSSVAFDRNGDRVVTGNLDGTARIWDVRTGKLLHELDVGTEVTAASFSPDGRFVLTADTGWTVELWTARTGRLWRTLQSRSGAVCAAAFSGDGRTVATGSADGAARLWAIPSGRLLGVLHAAAGGVFGVAFDGTGGRLATAGSDGVARVWDVRTRRLLATMTGDGTALANAVFSPDGRDLLATDDTGKARLWRLPYSMPGASLAATLPAKLEVEDAVFGADGATVVTAGSDETARVWDIGSGALEHVLRGHLGDVTSIAADAQVIITAATDGTAKVWDAASGGSLGTVHVGRPGRTRVANAPDGTQYAVWNADAARIFGSAGSVTLQRAKGVRSLVFSPDGREVATAGGGGVAEWDRATGRRLRTLSGAPWDYNEVAYSADGSRLVATGAHTTVWTSATGRKARTIPATYGTISPDAAVLVGRSETDAVRVWDTATGHIVATLRGADQASPAAFSADGALVAIAGTTSTRIWNLVSGEVVATLPPRAGIAVVGFSPDGTLLLTAGDDGTTRLWAVASGTLLHALPQ
jgi:WD40 repeat protein